MGKFLLSALILALIVGVPTVAIWIRSGRKTSLQSSYHNALLYLAKWFGVVYALVATIILGSALADMLFSLGFGYPVWSLPICVVMIAAGLMIRRLAATWLGNRTGDSLGEWPHYHRRGSIDPTTGKTLEGQGIGRHRPWQTSRRDQTFWDRF